MLMTGRMMRTSRKFVKPGITLTWFAHKFFFCHLLFCYSTLSSKVNTYSDKLMNIFLVQDICDVCPEKLPNYEAKIKNFFEEHLHTDEEIRYCLEGSGRCLYFRLEHFSKTSNNQQISFL